MSSCLRRNKELLRFLCQTKPNVLESIVKEVSTDLMKSITEWSQDVSKGNVPLSSSPKKKFSFKQKINACVVGIGVLGPLLKD